MLPVPDVFLLATNAGVFPEPRVEFKDLSGEELQEAMIKRIKEKDEDLKGRMETQGTTPRQLTDLLGSLADLTSGSGDKGTPVILIQNYFTNYAHQ